MCALGMSAISHTGLAALTEEIHIVTEATHQSSIGKDCTK